MDGDDFKNPGKSTPRGAAGLALRDLLIDAGEQRMARYAAVAAYWSAGVDECAVPTRAKHMLEPLLADRLPATIDACAYLTRVASLLHMATPAVDVMASSIQALLLTGRRARAIAVALAEIVHFVEMGVDPSAGVDLRVAVAHSEVCGLVVRLEVQGAFVSVPSELGVRALLRARDITQAIGGDFVRNATDERMVLVMSFEKWRLRMAPAAHAE